MCDKKYLEILVFVKQLLKISTSFSFLFLLYTDLAGYILPETVVPDSTTWAGSVSEAVQIKFIL